MMEHGYKKFHSHKGQLPRKQKGALTMFSAVLILILLTELIIYAVQVGVFEQRKSANEMRQKEAFHVAESAIQFSKEYLLANARSASGIDWLANRWKKCSDLTLPVDGQGTHPCYGEPADNATDYPADLRNNMYYYFPDSEDERGAPDAYGNPTLPIDVDSVIPDGTQRASVYALLCMLRIERDPAAQVSPPNSVVQGCTMEPDLQDPVYFMITLMARGEADCDGGTCSARALITDKVGSFGPIGGEGGPGVPLTTKSTFPPSGTSEIVPNPNGGGVGVPISAWMNNNTACPNQLPVDPTGGSWSTCERHEWYGTDSMPDDFECPTANCSCGTDEKRLSYSDGGDELMGMDLVPDDSFPCDLWYYLFGLHKYIQPDDVEQVVDQVNLKYVRDFLADEIVQAGDCDDLATITTPDADGNYPRIIWIEGGNCNFTGNKVIGSPEAPVFLISAANTFKATGTVSIFGTVFLTDVLDSAATLDAHGTMTVYGAVVVDATMGHYTGTFQLVYIEDIIKLSLESGKFGNAAGGWSDFHQDWR